MTTNGSGATALVQLAEASTTRPGNLESKLDLRPSCGDRRSVRTPGRRADETGASPEKMVANRPDEVHSTTRAKIQVERRIEANQTPFLLLRVGRVLTGDDAAQE